MTTPTVNVRITVRVAKQDGMDLDPPRPFTWGVEVVCTIPTSYGPEERFACVSDHDKREQARAAARELRADQAEVLRVAARLLGLEPAALVVMGGNDAR